VLRKYRLQLGNGMKVRIFGHLDVYAATGRFGLKMSSIDPRFTLGELAIQREDVVRRLVAAGLFDANRKRVLAARRSASASSPASGSAAWADFHSELQRSGDRVPPARRRRPCAGRCGGADGHGRHPSARAMRRSRRRRRDPRWRLEGRPRDVRLRADRHLDRGVPAPGAHGLGHEVDRSVADEVAHTAYKTPTACAAALVDRVNEFVGRSERAWSSITERAARAVDTADQRLAQLDADDRDPHDLGGRARATSDSTIVRHGCAPAEQSRGPRRDRVRTAAVALARAPGRLDARVAPPHRPGDARCVSSTR
jgi:exodeoxyribonuclease VII large subunit